MVASFSMLLLVHAVVAFKGGKVMFFFGQGKRVIIHF